MDHWRAYPIDEDKAKDPVGKKQQVIARWRIAFVEQFHFLDFAVEEVIPTTWIPSPTKFDAFKEAAFLFRIFYNLSFIHFLGIEFVRMKFENFWKL